MSERSHDQFSNSSHARLARKHRRIWLAATAAAGLTAAYFASSASAITYTFTGAEDVGAGSPTFADWSKPGNWAPAGLPTAADDVLLSGDFMPTGVNRPLIYGPGYAVNTIYADGKFVRLEDYSGSGSVTLAMNSIVNLGEPTRPADFYIRAGIATVNSMNIRYTDIGQAGPADGVGELRLNAGGTINTTGEMIIGRLDNAFGNGKGILRVDAAGGTVTSYAIYVGAAGGAGTFLQGGGSVSSFYPLHVGTELLSTAYYELNGGTLISGTEQPNAYMFIGRSGAQGRFVHNAGYVSTGDLYLASDGSGNAVYEMNGGTLSASGIFMGTSGSPTGTFTWNAGTIVNRPGLDLNWASFSSTLDIQLLGAGAHVVDVEAGRFANLNASAYFSGDGKLTKTGAGVMNLAGFSTHSGGVEIQAGTLYVLPGGNVGTGPVTNQGAFNVYGNGNVASVSGAGSTNVGDGSNAVTVSVGSVRQSALALAAQASVTVTNGSAASVVGALSLAGPAASPTATLDLGNNALAVDYTGASPLADLTAQVVSGRAGGAWTGTGISSSAAATNSTVAALGIAEAADVLGVGGGTFAGVAVDGTAVLIRYTRLGDANLDGTTGIGDFSLLGSNYNQPGGWGKGDFNYDGTVGIGDFSLLAANYNQTAPASTARGDSVVPEPSALAGLAVVALLAHRRRQH